MLFRSSDDGRVHVTQDGGASWRSVEDRMPGLPKGTWCAHLEAGKHDAATAFAVFDGHRTTDWTPYVFVTRDYGETWASLATPAIDGYCLVLEQDPVRAELLWLGTEFGLYVTIDGGANWHRWSHGVPACSAMAITTHPRDHDLIVATHGRSIFVLDDITPLRTLSAEVLAQKLHVFPVQAAVAFETAQTPGSRFPGQGEFRGATRQRGAFVHLIVNAPELKHPDAKIEKARAAAKAAEKPPADKPADAPAASDAPKPKPKEEPKDKVTIEVRDAAGVLVRTFREDVKLGLNRIVWRLERDGGPRPARELQEEPELPTGGREVLPGEYTLTVRFQGEAREQRVVVLADPRVEIAATDRAAKDTMRAQRDEILADLHRSTQRLARARRDVDVVEKRLALEVKPKGDAGDPQQPLRDAVQAVKKALDACDEKLWGPKPVQGIVRDDDGLLAKVQTLLRVTRTPDAPNPTEVESMAKAAAKAPEVAATVDEFVSGPLATFRAAVEASGLSLLPGVEPVPQRR